MDDEITVSTILFIVLGFIIVMTVLTYPLDVFKEGPVYGITDAPVQCIDFKKPFYQHIHVSVKGIKIPALVGITYNCFKEMHTHTNSGIIHIESNTPKNFTLGQFFDVWGKSTMGYTSLTINGKPATFMTVLKDQDKIVIRP